MCRAVTCRTCGKTTWAGCGQHVDQVMAGVPEEWCNGQHRPAKKTCGSGSGLLAKLFGRR